MKYRLKVSVLCKGEALQVFQWEKLWKMMKRLKIISLFSRHFQIFWLRA